MAIAETDPFQPWLDKLIPRLAGATEERIRSELEHTIHDFCREGEPWQELLGPYATKAGDPIVALNPIDSKRGCIYVKQAYWKGSPLMQATMNSPEGIEQASAPSSYVCDSAPNVVRLMPTPTVDEDTAFYAHCVLCPRCPDEWLPDFFRTHHFEAILAGVLGRMHSEPSKTYSDERVGAYYLSRYRNRTREARDMATRGNLPNGARWQFPAFGV